MKEKIDPSLFIKHLFEKQWKETFIINGLDGRIVSYEDFLNVILNYKDKLEDIGLKKGETICLLMSNSLELAILYFTALIMELVVVPIDPNRGEEEIKEVLSLVASEHVFCNIPDYNFISRKIEIDKSWDVFYEPREIAMDELSIFDSIDYEKLFLITFTSGSTGVPKGVMHSFKDLFLSAVAFNKKFGFGEGNIFYHNLPMAYMAGILNLLILPFLSESKIIIGERFSVSNVARFWDIPVKYSANSFWFNPTIISLLLNLDRGVTGINYTSNSNIVCCVGTAPLNIQVKNKFENKYKTILYESYGLSETLFVSTNSPEEFYVEKSVGKLLEGVELCFGKDNEIMINVPWRFLGYANLSNDVYFDNGRFKSGDIGNIDKEGFLFITDRKKDIIIRGGMNLSPRRLEDFISKFNVFTEFFILGIEDLILGEKIVCFFVSWDNLFSDDTKKELNNDIIKRLGRDYCIDQFVRLEEIPKNINGKVDKLKIKNDYMMIIK